MASPVFKRAFDVVASGLGLVALLPVLAAVAAVVRASMGGPVLFRQVRPGYLGRPFTLYKFRTMRDANGPDGRPLPDSERLTRVGWALRKSSLDELPQLWNVLRGDLSLVGPRPLLMGYLPLYSPEQARRHDVRPGITGWAQVLGRNAIGWERRFELDVWYVDHRSTRLDLKILWMTARKVATSEGVAAVDRPTPAPFRGTSPTEAA